MVDPFYQKAQSQGVVSQQQSVVGQASVSSNPQQQAFQVQQQQIQLQIQQLNQQQQLLQQQYAQLTAIFQNPQTNQSQRQQVQLQMQQLNAQYQQNAQSLQTLAGHINKPVVVPTKSSGGVGMKGILIGCASFLVLIVGGLVGVFYYLLQNPKQLSSVGLDPSTTKTLLQVFSTVFFGLLVFGGMAMLIVNIYRLITVKNKSKVGNGIGSIIGLIIFIASISLGSKVLSLVNNISTNTSLNTDDIVLAYMTGSTVHVKSDPNLKGKLIAPSSIYFMLNSTYFASSILPALGSVNVTAISLDCGNGQSLSMLSNYVFGGNCVYLKKGEYPLSITVSYVNTLTQENMIQIFTGSSLIFQSEIGVSSTNGDIVSDKDFGIIVGKNPAKVSFDSLSVFRDYNLPDYNITWYLSDDGNVSAQNVSSITHVYTGAKVYNIKYRIPSLNNFLYSFPIRVELSDVPVCEVASKFLSGTKHSINTSFYDKNVIVTAYKYEILDKSNKGVVIDSLDDDDGNLDYQFPGQGIYSVKVNFVTNAGKQGSCESDDIKVGNTDFNLSYSLNYKTATHPQYKKIGSDSGANLDLDTVILKEIPSVIQLVLNSVVPNNVGTTKRVILDGKTLISTDNKTWEITINDSNDHQISIVVEDVNRGMKTQKDILVKVKKDDIVGKLLIKPSSVGTDPFEVAFDASTTVLNDVNDEIVYFTWNFGDGEIKKNLSQSVIKHTYRYDMKKENGEYKPVLIIKTKKGREISISPDTNIVVKKALSSLKINVDSHPAQIANIADRVSLSLQINGLPDSIEWNFGNGKTLSCKGRECIQATAMYDKSGEYTVRATVIYPDQPTVEGSINLRIK